MEGTGSPQGQLPAYAPINEAEASLGVKKSNEVFKTLAKIFIVLLLVGGFAVVFSFYHDSKAIEGLLHWIDEHRAIGLLAFCAIYVVGTVLAVASGALFGLPIGATIVWFSALIGETIAFVIGRFLLRDVVAKQAERYEMWSALEGAISEEGWKIVLLLRLAPIIPFALLNYVLGSTAVPFAQFFLASSIGIIPGMLVYVYLGTVAADISDITKGHTRAPRAVRIALIVVSIIACIVALVGSTLVARRSLLKRLQQHRDQSRDQSRDGRRGVATQPLLQADAETPVGGHVQPPGTAAPTQQRPAGAVSTETSGGTAQASMQSSVAAALSPKAVGMPATPVGQDAGPAWLNSMEEDRWTVVAEAARKMPQGSWSPDTNADQRGKVAAPGAGKSVPIWVPESRTPSMAAAGAHPISAPSSWDSA